MSYLPSLSLTFSRKTIVSKDGGRRKELDFRQYTFFFHSLPTSSPVSSFPCYTRLVVTSATLMAGKKTESRGYFSSERLMIPVEEDLKNEEKEHHRSKQSSIHGFCSLIKIRVEAEPSVVHNIQTKMSLYSLVCLTTKVLSFLKY